MSKVKQVLNLHLSFIDGQRQNRTMRYLRVTNNSQHDTELNPNDHLFTTVIPENGRNFYYLGFFGKKFTSIEKNLSKLNSLNK